MKDVVPFGGAIGLVALAALLAVWSNRVSQRILIPAPAIFLILAAVASDVYARLRDLPIHVDQRLVTIALIVILFDGGMHIGWRRFRPAAGAVAWIGLFGTAVTTIGLAVLAHLLFGFGWHSALLVGAALAPTDPAVVFSVLGNREIHGRTGTILEGESGANDPVGIAVMFSLLGATGGGAHAVWHGVSEFALEMVVGGAVGVLGGFGLRWIVQHVRLPAAALYPVQTLACACVIYGATAAAHGSGFLAVFLAGIIVGDVRVAQTPAVKSFLSALASIGEIVAFVVLGLTISVSGLWHSGDLWTGLGLAALLILVVRPVLVGALLLPLRLDWGERAFVAWAGLKGAVPILLGTFVLTADVDDAGRIYGVVFVAVLVSVLVQGSSIPFAARLARVPIRKAD